jgi:hypothetical protein
MRRGAGKGARFERTIAQQNRRPSARASTKRRQPCRPRPRPGNLYEPPWGPSDSMMLYVDSKYAVTRRSQTVLWSSLIFHSLVLRQRSRSLTTFEVTVPVVRTLSGCLMGVILNGEFFALRFFLVDMLTDSFSFPNRPLQPLTSVKAGAFPCFSSLSAIPSLFSYAFLSNNAFRVVHLSWPSLDRSSPPSLTHYPTLATIVPTLFLTCLNETFHLSSFPVLFRKSLSYTLER